MSLRQLLKIIAISFAFVVSKSTAKEIVAPLGFPVIIPKNVDRSALQTEFGRNLDHSLEFVQHRGMSLQGNDAFLVGPQRAVTEASTKSIMIFPAPMHLPASPISPYPIWRPQQTKTGAEENAENLDESLSRPPKAISLTIKRNEEQEPKALALQQSQPNQRTYRSDNSAREYKIIRRLRSDPGSNLARQASLARYLLFKKAANVRNTRTSNDQNDYYLRFLPGRNTRTSSGDHSDYYLRFLPGQGAYDKY